MKEGGGRGYLLVNAEDPALDIRVVAVRHVLHGKHRPVLDRSPTVGPESRISLVNQKKKSKN